MGGERQRGRSLVKEGWGGGGRRGGCGGERNMATGVALAAPAREARELGLGQCGGFEQKPSAIAMRAEDEPRERVTAQ